MDDSLDLPSLQSIQLGFYSLHGRYDDEEPCYSLTMRSMNEVVDMNEFRSSKSNIFQIWGIQSCVSPLHKFGEYYKVLNFDFLDIPNVQNVSLLGSYWNCQSKSISSTLQCRVCLIFRCFLDSYRSCRNRTVILWQDMSICVSCVLLY